MSDEPTWKIKESNRMHGTIVIHSYNEQKHIAIN